MTLENGTEFAVWMILAGLTAAMVWYGARLEKHRLPVSAMWRAAVLGPVFALICAKACYLIHDLGVNLYEGSFGELTAFTADTFSFAGGALGFTAGTALAARRSGIRSMKALDLFAAPGCVLICLARIAEAGMDTIGMGDEAPEWLRFFPFASPDSWGDMYLNVFALMAVTALACLIPALRPGDGEKREGDIFRRTAVCLLSAQIFLEMLLQYPFIRTFITSFVSLEQVLCAVLLLAITVRGCVRNRKWTPAAAIILLLGVSAFFQFYRDNKIPFVFEEGWEWALENARTISITAFFLVSAGLAAAGFAALRPSSGAMTAKNVNAAEQE